MIKYSSIDKMAVLIENTYQAKCLVSLCIKYGILRRKGHNMTYPYYVTITQVSSGDYIADDNTQNDMSKKDSIRALGYFVVTASQFADAVKQNFSDKEV